MKVLCIKEDTITVTGYQSTSLLRVSEIYTVLNHDSADYYQLAEMPYLKDAKLWFHASLFAPISEIDELEFERNYNLVPINQ